MIANLTVTDVDQYRIYEKGFFSILKRHGGSFLTVDDKSEMLEGEKALEGRVVLFKFDSEMAAKQWYDDPDYQKLSEHRRLGTTLTSLTMVHGLPLRN